MSVQIDGSTGNIIAIKADYSGDVSIGGTLTYEDVTNIDAVGLITARNGIKVDDLGVQVGTGATIDGATNTLTFLTNGSERLRVDSSGNLGIGAAAPKEVIDARGAAVFSGDHATSQNAYGTAHGIMLSSTSNLASIKAVSNGSNDVAIRFIPLSSGSGSEAMRIDSSGRLLLGTTTEGYSSGDDLTIATSGHTGITLRSGTTSEGAVYFSDATSGGGEYVGSLVYSHNTNSMAFTANGAERMRMNSSGSVLMGSATAATAGDAQYALLQMAGNTAGTSGSVLALKRGEAASQMSSGDSLGTIIFTGTTGGDFASIRGSVDGSPSGSVFPGRIVFSTTASGASSPTERMRITSDGKFGFGTSSPSSLLHGEVSSGSAILTLKSTATSGEASVSITGENSSGTARTGIFKYDNSDIFRLGTSSGIALRFETNDAERMRIDSSGRLLVGTTSLSNYGTVNAYTNASTPALRCVAGSGMGTGSAVVAFDKHQNVNSTSQVFAIFTINSQNTGSGRINANGASQAAFGSFSDRRLKENIVDLPSQLENVCKLRPVEFDYIEPEGGGHQTSFIAQEFEEVFPDAVGEREDGMKTLTGWGKTEAILVKALQEAVAKIEILEAKVAALEG